MKITKKHIFLLSNLVDEKMLLKLAHLKQYSKLGLSTTKTMNNHCLAQVFLNRT